MDMEAKATLLVVLRRQRMCCLLPGPALWRAASAVLSTRRGFPHPLYARTKVAMLNIDLEDTLACCTWKR